MTRVARPVVALLVLAAGAGAAPVIFSLGNTLDPGNNPCGQGIPSAISGDGSAVCGVGGCAGFKWDTTLGMQNLGGGAGDVYNLSANGSVVVGNYYYGSFRATRFLPGNTLHDLGTLPGDNTSSARAVSDNGQAVAGFSYFNNGGTYHAFRWLQSTGQMQQLLPLADGTHAQGLCISGDGNVVFGVTVIAMTGQSAPTRWATGFPAQAIPTLQNPTQMVPNASNTTGSIVVGTASYTSQFDRAFRWTPGGGTEELAPPFFGLGALANDLTPDGLAIVGNVIVGPNFYDTHAGVYTDTYGWTDLNDLLPAMGVNLNGWVLTRCAGISHDGTTLTGWGTYQSSPSSWLVRGIQPLCGPRIDLQPINTTKCAHATAVITSFSSPPSGFSTMVTRQWFKRVPQGTGYVDVSLANGPGLYGSTFSGTQTTSLSISNLSMADAGEYFCRHTGGCAPVDTNHITLTVLPNLSGGGGPIGTSDLVFVLGNFGNNVPPFTSGDVNGDGVINTADLTIVLGSFGTPCP